MAQNGRKMRIKIDDGSGTLTTIAGAQEDSMTLENGEIDITNKDSDAKRELLERGTQSVNLSCNGVYYAQDEGNQTLYTRAQEGTIDAYTVEFEDGEMLEGNFQIGSYERTGEHSGATMFTCELKSSGAITYTAPTAA